MTAALLQAEDALAAAQPGDEDPQRVWFFQQASRAHKTTRTLWTLGDLEGAFREFHNSVLTRKAGAFSRAHAATLGYTGTVQVKQHRTAFSPGEMLTDYWRDASER